MMFCLRSSARQAGLHVIASFWRERLTFTENALSQMAHRTVV
jgi:hypothetical protein